MSWLRPEGVIIDGELHRGLEVAIHHGVIEEIRASSARPEPYILSPAFVNAHSHLEYRGMLDQIPHPEYYEWIYELTRLKPLETPEFVREQCMVAAKENRATGVAWMGEHSDRTGSAEAMIASGLGGWIFQEVITANDVDVPARMKVLTDRLQDTKDRIADQPTYHFNLEGSVSEARVNRGSNDGFSIEASLNPHAYFTVDRQTLRELGENGEPSSIHLAETIHESHYTRTGTGPLADRRRSQGIPFEIYGQSVVEVLNDLGVLRPGMQCVHCCDIDKKDIEILSTSGVTIAHCPRSNVRLQCPISPVREMLDAGLTVGLGMDSPASGGPIDMFAEMRSALDVSQERNAPLTPKEVWRMATSMGYQSFGAPKGDWNIAIGSKTPLIKIATRSAASLSKIIEDGGPADVSWLAGAE